MGLGSQLPEGRSRLVRRSVTAIVALAASSSCGGNTPSALSGSAVLQFSPSFTAYFTTSGRCDPCGSNFLSTYDIVEVVMSDDPNLEGECESGNAQYSLAPLGYHYVTVEIVSPQTIGAANYPVGVGRVSPATPSPYAVVGESRPTNNGSVQADGVSGSVQLVQVADLVNGSFTVSTSDASDDSAPAGSLSGSFVAPSCPLLFNLASDPVEPSSFYELFQSPCPACPG